MESEIYFGIRSGGGGGGGPALGKLALGEKIIFFGQVHKKARPAMKPAGQES